MTKATILTLTLLFLLANTIIYNHAYQFTHFNPNATKRTNKPEKLTLPQKLKTLFNGITIPRPTNESQPTQAFKTIYLQSHEKIEGWLIENPNPKGTIIQFHGYSSKKSGILNYSDEFQKLGYNTFLIDFMGSGGSTGNTTTIGYKESKDVKVAYNYIKENYPNQKIILHGSSMGAVAIMKSIHDDNIKPDQIIIECPFGSMRKTTQARFEAMNLPTFILPDWLLLYGGLQNGFNPYKHVPTNYAKKITIPTLLITGAKDARVSQQEINDIYTNLQGQKTLKILEQAQHENYLNRYKKEWLTSVTPFLQ